MNKLPSKSPSAFKIKRQCSDLQPQLSKTIPKL